MKFTSWAMLCLLAMVMCLLFFSYGGRNNEPATLKAIKERSPGLGTPQHLLSHLSQPEEQSGAGGKPFHNDHPTGTKAQSRQQTIRNEPLDSDISTPSFVESEGHKASFSQRRGASAGWGPPMIEAFDRDGHSAPQPDATDYPSVTSKQDSLPVLIPAILAVEELGESQPTSLQSDDWEMLRDDVETAVEEAVTNESSADVQSEIARLRRYSDEIYRQKFGVPAFLRANLEAGKLGSLIVQETPAVTGPANPKN